MHASIPHRLLWVGCWAAAAFSGVAAHAQAPAQADPAAPPQARTPARTQTPAAPQAGRSDPLDAQAAVPAAVHRSAFASYRVAGEPQVGHWNEANKTVARIGGWRTYAREVGAPAPAVVVPSAVAPAVAASAAVDGAPRNPAGHTGHGDKP